MTAPQIRVGDVRLQGAQPTGQFRVGDVRLTAPAGGQIRVGDVRLTKPAAPVINYLVIGGTAPTTSAPYAVTATLNVTDPAGGPLAVSIDWGDGSPVSTGLIDSVVYDPDAPPPDPVAGHTYLTPGDYQMLATVSSPSGRTAQLGSEVLVTGPGLRRTFAVVAGGQAVPLLLLGIARGGQLQPVRFDGLVDAGFLVDPNATIDGPVP